MKKASLFIGIAAVFAFTPLQAAPQVSIEQALKVANSYLKENGRGDVWITAIALEKPAAGAAQVWAITWSSPVALDNTKRETGIEVTMDGTIARYTEKVSNANSPATVGVPADRAPLSNHRTRTTRPSVLDLKH